MPLTFKAWDVIVCRNNHPCMLVVRPFSLSQGEVPYNSNFLVIDGGEAPKDGIHWSAFRCRRCGELTIMDELGLMVRKQKQHE